MDKERWKEFSLMEQMGNIASEAERMWSWQKRGDKKASWNCFTRVLELIDITREGSLTPGGRREIGILREVLSDVYLKTGFYSVSVDDLRKYLLQFAVAARR